MTYNRVIPRDFFNEAKLLKCLGRLSLKALDGPLPQNINIEFSEDGEPFEIDLYDNYLRVVNYEVFINGRYVVPKTVYNSKHNYPLYINFEGDDFLVFDEEGEFTEEFISRFSNMYEED